MSSAMLSFSGCIAELGDGVDTVQTKLWNMSGWFDRDKLEVE